MDSIINEIKGSRTLYEPLANAKAADSAPLERPTITDGSLDTSIIPPTGEPVKGQRRLFEKPEGEGESYALSVPKENRLPLSEDDRKFFDSPLFEKDAGGRVILNNQYADKIGDILVRSQSQPWSLTAEDKAMLRDFQAKTADIQISTPVGATTERLQQMKDYADTLDYRAQAGNEDSYSLKSEKTERIAQSLKDKAVPFRSLELTPENWRQEFGDSLTVDTPIGRVKMGENQYAKLLAKNRGKHFGLIKPTLTEPL